MKPLIFLTIAATKRYTRNISTLVFSLFVPIALILVFGAFTNQSQSKLELGVIDQAKSEISMQFLSALDKYHTFNIENGSEADEKNKIDNGKKDIVIIIPQNFNNILSCTKNISTDCNINISILKNINRSTQGDIGQSILLQVLDDSYNFPNSHRLVNINPQIINSKNLTTIDFLVPGLIAQSIMQLGIFGVAFAFVSQKATGVLKRLLATPIKAWNIIVAEGFSRVVISLIQICILIFISIKLYNLKVVGNIFGVFGLALMGSVIFLSIGFAIAGYSKDENQVAPIAQLIQLPMLLLSGVFFTRDIFPDWLKSITDFFPLTYLTDGMREIMNNGAGFDVIGKDVIGLFVWMIISFFIAYKLFKWE